MSSSSTPRRGLRQRTRSRVVAQGIDAMTMPLFAVLRCQCGVCRHTRLSATTGRGTGQRPRRYYGAGGAGGKGGAEAGDWSVVSVGGGVVEWYEFFLYGTAAT
ncbi:hypothetical protein, partial [Mycobacterium kansasii]|uniref:hypothetical protein n=1 Tax=Mycobacterium kansasii TaxID=1768 RepID=UPI001A9C412C